MAIAGLDVGTSGSKCTIFHDDGSVSAYSYREYALERSSRGYIELNPDRVWEAVRTVSPGLRGPRVGRSGRCALPPAERWACRSTGRAGRSYGSMPYTDPRGQEQCDRLIARLGRGEIMTRSGLATPPMTQRAQDHVAARQRPDVYRRMVTFLRYSDFMLFRLTGEKAVDWSLASRTLMFNVAKGMGSGAARCGRAARRPVSGPYRLVRRSRRCCPAWRASWSCRPARWCCWAVRIRSGAVVGGGAMEPRRRQRDRFGGRITPVFDGPIPARRCAVQLRLRSLYPPRLLCDICVQLLRRRAAQMVPRQIRADAVREAKPGASASTHILSPRPRTSPLGCWCSPPVGRGDALHGHPFGRRDRRADRRYRQSTLYRGLMEGVAYEMRSISTACARPGSGGPASPREAAAGRRCGCRCGQIYSTCRYRFPRSRKPVRWERRSWRSRRGLYRDIAEGARQLVRIRRTFEPDPRCMTGTRSCTRSIAGSTTACGRSGQTELAAFLLGAFAAGRGVSSACETQARAARQS